MQNKQIRVQYVMIPNIMPYMIMIDDYLGICFYMHLYATKQVK